MNLFDKHNTAARALIISLVLVAVCYANSLPNAFILDDVLIVGANERIRHIDPVHVLFQSYWGDLNHAGIYRPLTIFSFSLEYPLWKVWAPGFRLTNLLLHALNGWLVFLIASGFFVSPGAALATAVVYLVHPIQTEAVVSIVGRSELLAAAFFFSAWLAFRKRKLWLAAAAYFLATLAKESAITFPAVAMLDYMLRAGTDSESESHLSSGWCKRSLQRLTLVWRDLAVLAATGASYLALRFYVLGGLGIPASGQYLNGKLTLAERWITSGRVFLEYFRLLLAPVRIASDYDFNSVPVANFTDWDAWAGVLLVISLFVIAWRFAKVRPAVSFGILFFFLVLLPVSNWVMPIALLMAERFLYTPMFGVALLAGIVWSAIPEQRLRQVTAAGFVALAALLCISHNYVWQDTLTFHQNAVRVVPNNARARLGYGFALLRLNKAEEAKEQFEAGLRILPGSAPLLAGLASATLKIDGSCDRVRPLLTQALTVDPGQWHSLWVLGDCFGMEGNMEKAEQSYRLAIQNSEFPDAKLLLSWARILERRGETPAAVAAYQRAALIDPTDEGIQSRLRQLARSN